MIRSYAPALVFVGLGAILGLVFAYLNTMLGPKGLRRRPSTEEPYESGMPSEVKRHMRFGISFYLVAMLFILFDIEAIFLYPWAVVHRWLGWFGLIEMGIFVAILLVDLLSQLPIYSSRHPGRDGGRHSHFKAPRFQM